MMLFLRTMHALLSTLASFVLSPIAWVCALLILSFIARHRSWKKYLRLGAVFIFLLFSNARLLDWYAGLYQPSPVKLAGGQVFSCGIVAGGFASPDKDGNAIFNSTADRFIQVLKLYKQGHITHILLAGGNGKKELATFREAAWVKKELVEMGVPASVIFMEDASNNTLDNARNSKLILEAQKLPAPYLLISSAHHLPRASLLFKKAGVQTVAYPCSYIAGRGIGTWKDFIPSLGVLHTWDIFLKETAGYYWYR